MNKSILFVQPTSPTYTEIEDELVNPNHDKFGIADGDETSPSVTNSVQRGKRKWNVYAGINLPLGISYLSSSLKKHFPNNLEQHVVDYSIERINIQKYKNVDDWILAVAKESMPKEPDIIAISLMFSTAYKFVKKAVAIY